MKKFISYIFSISLFIFISMFILDVVYTKIYKNSIPRNTLQYLLKTEKMEFDVIFLGSSRVVNHIDTKLYETLSNKKTINLGVEGVTLKDNLLQLKLLIKNNKPISKIFLQLDTNFNLDSTSNVMASEAMPFLKNEIIKTHFKKYYKNFNYLYYSPFYRYIAYGPKIGFREAFFSVLNKSPRIEPSIGFLPKYGNDLSKQWVLYPSISNKNFALEEITKICDQNNIELILFTSPYCSKLGNRNYIEQLKNKIPYLLDLSNGYENELFHDCGHLNIKGAKLFTENLYYTSIKKDL